MTIEHGWPDFFARRPNLKDKKYCGPQKKLSKFICLVFLIFKPKTGHFKVYLEKMTSIKLVVHHYCSLLGPQKIFGGPHAARGPQFGHAWYKYSTKVKRTGLNSSMNNKKVTKVR